MDPSNATNGRLYTDTTLQDPNDDMPTCPKQKHCTASIAHANIADLGIMPTCQHVLNKNIAHASIADLGRYWDQVFAETTWAHVEEKRAEASPIRYESGCNVFSVWEISSGHVRVNLCSHDSTLVRLLPRPRRVVGGGAMDLGRYCIIALQKRAYSFGDLWGTTPRMLSQIWTALIEKRRTCMDQEEDETATERDQLRRKGIYHQVTLD